jgi:hypothetical protein
MAAKDNLSHEVLGSFTRRIAPARAGRAAENIAYGYESFEKTSSVDRLLWFSSKSVGRGSPFSIYATNVGLPPGTRWKKISSNSRLCQTRPSAIAFSSLVTPSRPA